MMTPSQKPAYQIIDSKILIFLLKYCNNDKNTNYSLNHFSSGSPCPVGYYGRNCSQPCGHCAGNGSCVKTNGICFGGCLPGHTGFGCRDDCPSNCGGSKRCSATTQFCTEGCLNGFYGLECNIRCDCSDGTPCKQKTGTCQTPRENESATLNFLWVTTDSIMMTPSQKPAYIYTCM